MGSKTAVMILALSLLVSVVLAQPLLEEGGFWQHGNEGDDLPDGEHGANTISLKTGREPDGLQQAEVDYTADLLDHLLGRAQKRSPDIYLFRRSCIRRGGACDHRPNDCCYNSSCRCNLWGTNCRCQRMGLFQQWGK